MPVQKALFTHKQADASLNLLARIIANENITITMNANAPTAYFDLQNRVLVLPAWENLTKDVAEATRGHEVAHALWTPAQGWHKDAIQRARERKVKFPKMWANCLNITEDARIERKLKEHLPGFRAVMERAYVEIYTTLLQQQNTTIDKMCAESCMNRVNFVAKAGITHLHRIKDAAEKLVYAEMMSLQTWEDSVACAEKLYDLRLKEMVEQKDDKNQQGMPQFTDDAAMADEIKDYDELTDAEKEALKQHQKNKQKQQKQNGKQEQKPKQEKQNGQGEGKKDAKQDKQDKADQKGDKGEGEQADKGEDQQGDAGQEGEGQERESNGQLGDEGSDASDQNQEGDGAEGSGDDDSDGESNDEAENEGKLGNNGLDKTAGAAGAPLARNDRAGMEAALDGDVDQGDQLSLEDFAAKNGGGGRGGKAVMPRIVARKQVRVRGLFE